jgi:hypothetical protein
MQDLRASMQTLHLHGQDRIGLAGFPSPGHRESWRADCWGTRKERPYYNDFPANRPILATWA